MDAQTIPQTLTRNEWCDIVANIVKPETEPPIRRSCRRYTMDGEARGTWRDAKRAYKRTWRVLEISTGGLTLKSYDAVPIDTDIELVVNLNGIPFALRGRIMHSTQTLGGYKLGVQLLF